MQIPRTVLLNSFIDTGHYLRRETSIYHRLVFECRDIMTDRLRRVPRIILSGSSYVWHNLSLSEKSGYRIVTSRFVKSTEPPQIHGHSNVSWCQSSCINIIHRPSFNYTKGFVAPSRVSTVLAWTIEPIQYGYYRTRYTRPTYRLR